MDPYGGLNMFSSLCSSLELVVEPWIENLWSALEKVLNITAKPVQSSVKGLIPKSDKSKTTIEESTTHSKTKIMALTLSELSDKLEGISLSNESSIASILKDENLEVSTKFSEPSLPGHYLQVDFVVSYQKCTWPTMFFFF